MISLGGHLMWPRLACEGSSNPLQKTESLRRAEESAGRPALRASGSKDRPRWEDIGKCRKKSNGPRKGERCYPCVRYDLSPMSRVAHSANWTSSLMPPRSARAQRPNSAEAFDQDLGNRT